jgi:DNA-binding MarR family transcriptional regulator
MDAVFFSMKRAHLGVERLGRRFLKEFALTPARFDLLNTIVDCEERQELMTQAELWKRLGVVRSAVCEMVKELVEAKLLKRHRAADSRTWIVRLTELGRRLQKEAFDVLINGGIATQWADSLITKRLNIDPAPVRHHWTQIFFSIGADLGNWVRRNTDLYTWDIEEFYAELIAPNERDIHEAEIPWVDEIELTPENSVEVSSG